MGFQLAFRRESSEHWCGLSVDGQRSCSGYLGYSLAREEGLVVLMDVVVEFLLG